MTARRLATALALLALAGPAAVAAQGLGDAAARERVRRDAARKAAAAKAAEEAKVFTNEDLEAGRPPGAKPGEAQAAPAEAGSAPAESPPLQDRFGDERPYLDALQAAQTRLAGVEQRIQELRAKLNPMSSSFIYGAYGSNSANEEAQVREQLSQAEAELDEARQAVAAANQSLQDFKQGRPPAPPPQ